MSINGNYAGGVIRPLPVRLTALNATDIVTGYDNSVVVDSFGLANETGTAVQMSCHYYSADTTTSYLIFARSVPANDTVIVTDIPIRLYTGDKFTATAGTINAITVNCTVTNLGKSQFTI